MTYTPPYAPPVTGCGRLGCLEPERARAIRKANADLTAEVARLREALEPFGRVTELPARHAVPDDQYFAGTWLTWGDIRRASEVMGIGKP